MLSASIRDMTKLTLVIGNKNLSSWSFRPWLLLRQAGLAFEEEMVPLHLPERRQRILAWSPSGRVPVLLVDDFRIWDSLAICEFITEVVPSLWPADPASRAHGRAVSAEMHSGFPDLRNFLPMDFTARFRPPGKLLRAVERDIARVLQIWHECRELHAAEGPFLFGPFTVADAMYAPVVSRFLTYGIELDPVADAYARTMQSLPAWAEWAAAAAAEPRIEDMAASRPSPAAEEPTPRLPLRPASAGISASPTSEPVPVIRDPAPPIVASPPGAARVHVPVMRPAAASRPTSEPPSPPPERSPIPRPRPGGGGEIKPIGDGIHRRR